MNKRLWVIAAFYAGLAILMLNVLALHAVEYVPRGGNTDYYNYGWNYWWMRHALTTSDAMYLSNYIMQPMGEVNLGINAFTPIWFPIWAVLEPLLGSNFGLNVILWSGLILTGCWTYALLKEENGGTMIALLGGAIMMTQPYLGNVAELTHINVMAAFFYPLTIWLWKRVTTPPQPEGEQNSSRSMAVGFKWAILLGITFWLMWLTDNMWLLFIPFALAPYGLLTLYRAPDWQARWKLAGLGLLAIVIFAGLSWFLLPWKGVASFPTDLTSSANYEAAQRWSVKPSLFLMQPEDVSAGRSIGRLLTLVALLSVFVRGGKPERWFWLGISFIYLVICLGPYLFIGEQKIMLPYAALHDVLGGMFRTPERFLPGYVFCLLMFVAQSWPGKFVHWRLTSRVWVTAALLVIFLADLRALRPIKAGPPIATQYHFYELMAQEDDNYVVMDVPVSVASGWLAQGRNYYTQYNVLIHGKRVTNGFVTRVPDVYHYFYENESGLGWLGGFRAFDAESELSLRKYVFDLPIGYIIVHQDKTDLASGQAEDLIGRFNAMDFLCPVTVEGRGVLYATAAHPQRCVPRTPPNPAPNTYEIDFGLPGDEFFIGLGFHRQEIIGGPNGRWLGAQGRTEALLYVELPAEQEYHVTFEATSFITPRPLTIYAGDQELARLTISEAGFNPYTFEIPAALVEEKLTLRLEYGQPDSPVGGDPRPLSIALNWMRFEGSGNETQTVGEDS